MVDVQGRKPLGMHVEELAVGWGRRPNQEDDQEAEPPPHLRELLYFCLSLYEMKRKEGCECVDVG